MHSPHVVLLSLALTGWAVADLPKKAPLTTYSRLWTDSPFTSKPPPPPPGEVVDLLADYALLGVSPFAGGGYRVTMLNKKNPEDRITVTSNKVHSDGFKIIEVTRQPGDPLATAVRMSVGSTIGTVSFDEQLLVLAAPPAPKAAPKAPGAAPTQVPQPGQPAQPGMPIRPIRPRVVPPPATTTGGAVPGRTGTSSRPTYQRGDRGDRSTHRGGR